MPVPSTRGIAGRGALAAVVAVGLLAVVAAGVCAAPRHRRELSPDLARLAKPVLRSKSPARQAAALGLPRSGPGSLVREGRRVFVKVRFQRGALAGLADLRSAGARIVSASRRDQTVTVAAPPASLPDLTAVPGVRSVWPSRAPILYGASASALGEGSCEGGAAISEGLGQLGVDKAREAFGLRGKGVTVGVLSDSFDVAEEAADGSGPVATHAHEDILSGDLPGPAGTCSGQQVPVDVLAEGPAGLGEDEGRAMLQIVHDLAPHASLAFATAFESEESFAHNIEALARPSGEGGAGAQVVVDDVAYFEEPFFQDGPVAAAVNKVTAKGVTYLTSAGNDNLFQGGAESVEGEPGIASWEAPAFRDSGGCPTAVVELSEEFEEEFGPVFGLNPSHCMDFDPGAAADDTFGITVKPGALLTVDLQWAEPWNGVTSDLDAFLVNAGGKAIAASFESNAGKTGTQRPFELVQWKNKAATAQTVDLAINRYSGGEPRLKLALLENGFGVSATEYPGSSGEDVVGPTVFGHAGADDSSRPEEFSSRGPVAHYFEPVEGLGPAAPLGSPETIAKPDLSATDCGATTFFAQIFSGAWRFCGTSAAAPHAAAVAALLRQGDPTASPQQVREALAESADPVSTFGPDAVGAGLVDALGAVEELPPAGPVEDPPSTVVPPLETEGPIVASETEVPHVKRPATFIFRRPPPLVRTRHRRARVVFRFGSDQAAATFLCKLDAGPFRGCRSPFVRMLRAGRHTVRVKAQAPSGLLDLTPAVYRFRIVRVS
jgi:subtilisin family serine protease